MPFSSTSGAVGVMTPGTRAPRIGSFPTPLLVPSASNSTVVSESIATCGQSSLGQYKRIVGAHKVADCTPLHDEPEDLLYDLLAGTDDQDPLLLELQRPAPPTVKRPMQAAEGKAELQKKQRIDSGETESEKAPVEKAPVEKPEEEESPEKEDTRHNKS